jgi:hypothetical protein
MNWKLILQLSLFGLAMALATISLIPSAIEPIFWLLIFLICAYLIAVKAPGKHFLHGFFVSLVNSAWITTAHVVMYGTYMANHPEQAEMSARMPLPDHPQLMMVLTGPVIGALSGLVLGLFSFIAGKIVRKSG